jgi:hypothetical protein
MDSVIQGTRFNSKNLTTMNSDGSFNIKDKFATIEIFTSSHYDIHEIKNKYDHSLAALEGHILDSKDFRNVEITLYMKANDVDNGSKIVYSARGGTHTRDDIPYACEGSAYKISLYCTDGKVEFVKEQLHGRYSIPRGNNKGIGKIIGNWIGFKGVVYNLDNGNVKLETYIDKDNDNTWNKIDEIIDSGGWGENGTMCKGTPDQIISWGGPIVKIGFINIIDLDFKNISVREILACGI